MTRKTVDIAKRVEVPITIQIHAASEKMVSRLREAFPDLDCGCLSSGGIQANGALVVALFDDGHRMVTWRENVMAIVGQELRGE